MHPRSLQEINSVTRQVRKVLETGNTTAAVINSFPEFADPEYQNTVDKVFRTKVGHEPSYNIDDRVVFKIEPSQGRWVPASTSLVMSVQVTKSDGTPTTDADVGPVFLLCDKSSENSCNRRKYGADKQEYRRD